MLRNTNDGEASTHSRDGAPLAAKLNHLYRKWQDAKYHPVLRRQIVEQILRALGVSITAKAGSHKRKYPSAEFNLLRQAGRLAAAACIERYDPYQRTSFPTYLFASIDGGMRSEATAAAERDRRAREETIPIDDEMADPDDWTAHVEQSIVLNQYIEQLPLEYRIVLRARFVGRQTYAEIAALISCSESSVRRVEAAAKEKLRELIGDPTNI